MTTAAGIRPDLESIAAKLRPVLLRHGVIRAAIFGSLARGESRPDSDLDLLIEFAEEKSLLDRAGLKLELEAEVGRGVDVVPYRSLYHRIRDRVLAEEVPIL